MTELSRAQLQAWESSLQLASHALDDDSAGAGRMRGRLRSTVLALRESVELVRRLVDTLAATRCQLRSQQDQSADLIEHLPIPYLLTTDEGTVLIGNKAASEALNLSLRAVPGRNLLLYLDDRESWMQILIQVRATGVAATRAGRLRPRGRVASHIVARVSVADTLTGPAVQWFLTVSSAACDRPRHAGRGASVFQ